MTDMHPAIDEATTLIAEGQDGKALRTLRTAIATTEDAALRRAVHELATEAHEAAHGLDKIEWHRLMIETEPVAVSG